MAFNHWYRGVFDGGVLETLKFWLVIVTTLEHQPRIYKSMEQQTIWCLAAQMHIYIYQGKVLAIVDLHCYTQRRKYA